MITAAGPIWLLWYSGPEMISAARPTSFLVVQSVQSDQEVSPRVRQEVQPYCLTWNHCNHAHISICVNKPSMPRSCWCIISKACCSLFWSNLLMYDPLLVLIGNTLGVPFQQHCKRTRAEIIALCVDCEAVLTTASFQATKTQICFPFFQTLTFCCL